MTGRFDQKLERIRAGGKPRLLDLFSGCRGFTLGFERAGFEPVGGIDADADAARTYAFNFQCADRGRHEKPESVVLVGGDTALDQVSG